LKNQVATISFDACLTDDGNGGQLLFEDVLGAEDLYFKDDGGRLAEIVKRIIRTKFSNHAEIIYERIKGKQQKQIGKELEISQSYISRIYKRFCRDLSQELVATGYLKKGELKDFRKARTSNMPEPEQMPKIIYLTPKPELKPASKRGRPAFKPVKEFTRDAAEKLLKNGVSQYRIVKMYGFVDTGQVHYRLKKWGLLPEKKVPEQSGNLLERLRSDNVQLDKFNSVLIRCRDEIKEHERYADMEILYKLITGALAEYDKLESIAK
jgi:predicted XRE-type DNA-binding protein